MLTPYLVWIKIGAAALIVGTLISTGIWFRGVLSDRDKYLIERDTAVQTVSDVMAARNAEDKLREAITNAIKSIRITSNNRIQVIEDAPAPVGPVVTLIPTGVPQMSSLPIFGNHSASRTSAAAPES